LISKASKDDLGRETGIAGVELRGPLQQEVGSISALEDFP
jgi:hypothetical protein